MKARDVEQLLEVIDRLPEEKVPQVLDFARFLWWQGIVQREEATPFEVWAEELAQRKGFVHLTEEDVARIVHEARRARE